MRPTDRSRLKRSGATSPRAAVLFPSFLCFKRVLVVFVVIATLGPFAGTAGAARDYSEPREECRRHDPLRQPFFGDTHVHTVYSFDANGQDTRNTPQDAYRFAKGEQVGLQPYSADGSPQRTAQLRRPLDFTVLSDHAELLGEIRICSTPGTPGHDSDLCWVYQSFRPATFSFLAVRNLMMRSRFEFCGPDGSLCKDQAKIVWLDIQAAAEEAYDRTAQCSFTSFVGYEWTASVGNGENLHRNVVFRNEHVPDLPPSWVETPSAYDLWEHLQKSCVEGVEGCDALTIPHNSNLSGPGLMFASGKLTGPQDIDVAVDKKEAEIRQRWEPLVEIMQHKGDSECLPGRDTKDELCGFEKLSYNSFAGVGRVADAEMSAVVGSGAVDLSPDPRAMVRGALKKGMLLEQELGANPLKYGIIASTDTHLGTPGLVAEDTAKGPRRRGEPEDGRIARRSGIQSGRPRRTLGRREQSRFALFRHATKGGLRHEWHAACRALLWWLGSRKEHVQGRGFRLAWLRQGCANGGGPAGTEQEGRGPELCRLGTQGPRDG